MIRKWYKVLVALALVTRVRVEQGEEGWPQGAGGDSPRYVRERRLQSAVDYTDDHLMELESPKDLVSEAILHQDISEGEGENEVDVSHDDDEVEDLAYDSDIERINTKIDLEDVDTGKKTRHDKVSSELERELALRQEPESQQEQEPGQEPRPGVMSEFRTQHWGDKPKCLTFRRGRENVAQKELLSRDTRELVTREPSMYYDMKRARRRMLTFPRHATEDRSSWGAKILEALESALNTAAKKYGSNIAHNIDEQESITVQYPERRTFTATPPARTSVTSRYKELKRITFLADHRQPSTNIKHEELISSTSEIPRSPITRTTTPRKQTLPYDDTSSAEASSGQTDDKKIVDAHYKREKSYNTWSRSREDDDDDGDDPSEEQDGRTDVMPYAEETRDNVKAPLGRGQSSSSSSESEEVPPSAPKNILKGKPPTGKLLRTKTTINLHRAKTTARTFPPTDAWDTFMDQHSPKKTTKRVENFYPITYNSRLTTYESKTNENDEDSLGEADEKPCTNPSPSLVHTRRVACRNKNKSPDTRHKSSQQYSSEDSKHQLKEIDLDSSEELGLDLNHSNTTKTSTAEKDDIKHNKQSRTSTRRSTVNSSDVNQQPDNEINQTGPQIVPTRTVSPSLPLDTSQEPDQVSGRRNNEEFNPGLDKEPSNVTPGVGVMADPGLPAAVVLSGLEELFILPEASRPMRKHWDTFYKSVTSKATSHTVSLQTRDDDMIRDAYLRLRQKRVFVYYLLDINIKDIYLLIKHITRNTEII